MRAKNELYAIFTIALRDVTKFLRDKPRIAASFIFPVLFIGALGGALNANVNPGYNFLVFVFTGVLGQTLFSSTASGIISLVEDRQMDFSQEMFISPISRYTIIIGKIAGETFVSLVQALAVIIFGLIMGVPLSIPLLLVLIPFALVASAFGGAFGVLVLANLGSQRTANQIFPFLIFPQFFLAGVFNPITNLPPVLLVMSRLTPMTYAVDLIRSVYYFGTPEYSEVVLFSPAINLAVIGTFGSIFLIVGTFLFVRNERNK